MPPTTGLSSPYRRALFAVSSRLISCLVTESLLPAYYLPVDAGRINSGVTGVMVVLSTRLATEQPKGVPALKSEDVFAIIPLRSAPVLKNGTRHRHGYPIQLIDPLDIHPGIYELEDATGDATTMAILGSTSRAIDDDTAALTVIDPPDTLWRRFAKNKCLEESIWTTVENELISSLYWQKLAFERPPRLPSLASPAIEWEQSLVSGHPTHPMHRTRLSPSVLTDYGWYTPTIRFAKASRKDFRIQGPFIEVMNDLFRNIEGLRPFVNIGDHDHIIMPIHELQLEKIITTFPNVEVLPPEVSVQASSQANVRTVVFPELSGKALKLAAGVKISSALRTITHFTADFGPRFSRDIVPRLSINPEILTIEHESASAIYRGVDPDVAKHFTAVIRDVYVPKPGENVIVCAALLDWGHSGVSEGASAVEHLFGLDTELKRKTFLEQYIQIICEAFIPPLVHNGVAFEAHAQNVLARFDTTSGELLGFVVRDFGGLGIHPETLRASTGVDFEFLPDHCVVEKTLEDAYPKLYHALIHNHLQRLIRLLGMHHNGVGWEMLRKHLTAVIPRGHGLHEAWMGSGKDLLPGKCLMRMKLEGLYRDNVYSPFPNLIQYRGSDDPTKK
ncbi:hypothetical protein V5O48_001990 [Marasmius crinis-equi]|uniref:IucC family-domain-containing protein n=1 Tax=Marasmius crinis-equi TaxID=585013 RepID=A0ABR3FXC5_9AGAR